MICVTTFDLINAQPHFIIRINFAKGIKNCCWSSIVAQEHGVSITLIQRGPY